MKPLQSLLMLLLGALGLSAWAQPRLAERPLGAVAVISVPASLKAEPYLGTSEDETRRVAYQFTSRYFWASWGSVTRYKQWLVVSILAPDVGDEEYTRLPRAMGLSYEQRAARVSRPLGTGQVHITEGQYTLGAERTPAMEIVYVDKARRLQLAWHVVKDEMDTPTALAAIARMVASFRLVGSADAIFQARKAALQQDAQDRAERVRTARAMLQRELQLADANALMPGQPLQRDGVFIEWMSEPEPRYQLLLPLGRVRAAPVGQVTLRPRPVRGPQGVLGLGWREHGGGEWAFNNQDDDYLPFKGIGALLAARQNDPSHVYFYYAATVRVEEENAPLRLQSLRWFLDSLPEVRRRWREGSLIVPGKPEVD